MNISELEKYFESAVLPEGEIKLTPHETIMNCRVFVETSIATLRANSGNRIYIPCYERLMKFKDILDTRGMYVTDTEGTFKKEI